MLGLESRTDGSAASLAFVGWLASYSYPLGLFGTAITNCTQASDDAWRMALSIYTPLLIISMPLIYIGRAWAKGLRWFALPHLMTVLLAITTLPDTLTRSTLGTEHLCDSRVAPDSFGVSAPLWHSLYAPSQLLAFSTFVIFCLWFWRLPSRTMTLYPEPEL